jgi:hypothetical protein
MVIFFVEPIMSYFAQHVWLNSVAHAAGGFGLAIILQHYLKGDSFLSVYLGWLLVIICIGLHVMPFIKK